MNGHQVRPDDGQRWSMALLAIPLLLVAVFSCFWPTLRAEFVQDDYYFLARALGVPDPVAVPVEGPQGAPASEGASVAAAGRIYFRPFTQEILPTYLFWMWGENPLPYRGFALLLAVVNGWLLQVILRRATGNPIVSLLAAGFYATHSAHFLSVAWFSASAEAVMMCFALVSLLAFDVAVRRAGTVAGAFALMASLAAYGGVLVSKETALLLPVLLGAWAALLPRPPAELAKAIEPPGIAHRRMMIAVPHVSLLVLYLVHRTRAGGTGAAAGWLAGDLLAIPRNLAAYAAMILNVNREILRAIATGSGVTPLMALHLALVAVVSVALYATARRMLAKPLQIPAPGPGDYAAHLRAAVVWMGVGAAPLLAATRTVYGYYLAMFLGGLALALAALVSRTGGAPDAGTRRRAALPLAALVASILLANTSVLVEASAPEGQMARGAEVRAALDALRRDLPAVPKGTQFLVEGLSRRQWWAFGWGYSLPVCYGDPTIRAFSEHQDDRLPKFMMPVPFAQLRWNARRGVFDVQWSPPRTKPGTGENSAMPATHPDLRVAPTPASL